MAVATFASERTRDEFRDELRARLRTASERGAGEIVTYGANFNAPSGINAAVVGILGAAFYSPVWISAVLGPRDVAIALIGFILLVSWKAQPILVALLTAAASVLIALYSPGW